MTREELISGAQSLADSGGLKLATLEFSATDVVKVVPTPPPTVPAPTFTSEPFIVASGDRKGRVELHWSKVPGATYEITRDGMLDGVSTDETHYAVGPKSTGSVYGVCAVMNGLKSDEVTRTVKPASAPEPPPATNDPGPVVTDPTIPDTAQLVTVDEFNAKQQAGKSYLIKPGEYKFTGDYGLRPKVDGVGIYAEPGKVVIRHTGTNSFARCIDVLANAVKLFGLRGAGPKGTIVIQGNSGVRALFVTDCAGLDGECGQFLESKGITDAARL